VSGHPEDSSCELPASAPGDGRRFRRFDGTAWDGITPQVYKRGGSGAPGAAWRDVVRYTLLGAGEPAAFQLRYFEIGPGGYSSLEKHRHVHAVIVLRGRGRVVVGRDVFDVGPFDLVYVPPVTPHQFVNAGTEPFGFLCPVDADRDPPQPLTDAELRELMSEPRVRAALRVGDTVGTGNRD